MGHYGADGTEQRLFDYLAQRRFERFAKYFSICSILPFASWSRLDKKLP